MTRFVALIFALALTGVAPCAAQSQQQHDEVLNELKAIRQLLERLVGALGAPGQQGPPAAAPVGDKVKLTNLTGYVLGKADAPLTMVEFTDLQCPYCRRFHTTTFEQLKKDYIDTGKLRYLSRDFPLPALHPLANTAARASRCAGEQGKFWEMRHAILVNNAALTNESFATFAKDLKLNAAPFTTCISDSSRYDAEIQKDVVEGSSAGISGTPSFIIGRTTTSGLDGVRIVGAQAYAAFEAELKKLLAPEP
jgi:protein-disulfide isomerase